MNLLISIPREALAELLRAAGSPLTPEQYIASLPELGIYKKYPSRAWAAAISKYCILVVAVLGVLLLPILGFDIENLLVEAGLITVTYFEFRVHRYFRENNPKAPSLGYRNQALFAAGILAYCLYSAFMPAQLSSLSPSDMNLVEENNLIDTSALMGLQRIFYLVIALVAGGSQYALAVYYRGAQVRTDAA